MKNKLAGLLMLFSVCAHAQVENKDIQDGNDKYGKNDYQGAENDYLQSVQKNPKSEAGNFNLGDAYYQQQNYDSAAQQYQHIAQTTNDPNVRANAYHNLGNAYMQQKQYDQSIDAYKEALKNNPGDADTKYNLAYAQSMLEKQQQQNQNNKNQNQQDQKQQQNSDQNKQDQNKQNQQQNQADKDPDKNKQPNQQQQQNQQPKQYSKQELDQILQALNNQDKNVQDKINKQKMKSVPGHVDKDW